MCLLFILAESLLSNQILHFLKYSQWVPVHKSEVIKNTLDPDWMSFTISHEQLNNGDLKRPIAIEVWDWNRRYVE